MFHIVERSDPTHPPEARGGQAIGRAMSIVRFLGQRSPLGASVRDVARGCDLAVGTTHRLLQHLVAEDMVLRERAPSRLYRLGPMALGLGAEGRRHHFDWMRPIVRPHLAAMAAEWGCIAQLVTRVGRYGVCVERVDETVLETTQLLHPGESALLGYGAASVALLSVLPPSVADEILWENRWTTLRTGVTTEAVLAMLEKARDVGYGASDGMFLPNVTCVSMCVPARGEAPSAAISLYFGVSGLDEATMAAVVDQLIEVTRLIGARIDEGPGFRPA